MDQFFSAIIFIAVFLIIVYYLTWDFIRKKVIKRMEKKMQQKRYYDQKYYLISYLRDHLFSLERGELIWITVTLQQNPSCYIQITYNKAIAVINIIAHKEGKSCDIKDQFIKSGIQTYKGENDSVIFETKLDPVIVSNIVILILETIYNRKSNLYLKIKSS